MIVGDDQLHALQAASDEAVEEGAPMHLSLRQSNRHAEYPALALLGHPDRHQHRTIDQLTAFAHPLVTGIEEHVGRLVERPLAPGGQAGIERLCCAADLGRGNRYLRSKELDQDVTHLARGYALHVHLGEGKVERLLGARAFLQGGRIKTATAHLRNVEGLFAQAGHDGLGFEAIGVIGAFGRAFMRSGIQKPGALDLARFVDQDAQRLARTVESVGQQSRKSGVQGMMFYALCHGVDSFVVWGKNAPKKSPAETACRGRAAMFCRPPLFGRYAPSSLRPAKHRKTSRLQNYRNDVALTSCCAIMYQTW
jgi:hypothetical protein